MVVRLSDDTTLGTEDVQPLSDAPIPIVALTVIAHPDLAMVGQRSLLPDVSFSATAALSRNAPLFGRPGMPADTALGHRSLSRKPVVIEARGIDGIALLPHSGKRPVLVDGSPLDAERRFSMERIDDGVVIELSPKVAVLLHRSSNVGRDDEASLLSGASDAVATLRAEIRRVAPHDINVLIRGETGVGKERVAQALHRASRRRNGPFLTVNMAAIPQSTAASALFGHKRGAFTGASANSEGIFQAADGGTVFLDEIGDIEESLQVALLRVLQTGEILSVGSSKPRTVDVRVVAATDQDVDASLRQALVQRLRGYDLTIPPLRERREDIPRLLLEFLAPRDLPPNGAGVWLPSSLMALLVRYAWPGNVRELEQVVRRIAISSDESLQARLDPFTEAQLRGTSRDDTKDPITLAPSLLKVRNAREITETMVAEALEKSGYRPARAAKTLGVSRTTLYARIQASVLLRKAADLTAEELEVAMATAGGDLEAAATSLKVSLHGLRLRLNSLEQEA